jgi:hypothetical protein
MASGPTPGIEFVRLVLSLIALPLERWSGRVGNTSFELFALTNHWCCCSAVVPLKPDPFRLRARVDRRRPTLVVDALSMYLALPLLVVVEGPC